MGGRKSFGADALIINSKMFAMLWLKKRFAVNLPKEPVAALVASGVGKRFVQRPGRLMRNGSL